MSLNEKEHKVREGQYWNLLSTLYTKPKFLFFDETRSRSRSNQSLIYGHEGSHKKILKVELLSKESQLRSMDQDLYYLTKLVE